MNKAILSVLALLLIVGTASAATVSRNAPEYILPGAEGTMTFGISGLPGGEEFTLEETFPSGATLKTWTVTGAKEAKDDIKTRKKGSSFGWSFTPLTDSATVTYTFEVAISAPASGAFNAIYFDKNGFNKDEKTISFQEPKPVETPPTQTESPQAPASTPPNTDVKMPSDTKKSSSWMWWTLLILIVAVGAAYYLYSQKNKKPNFTSGIRR